MILYLVTLDILNAININQSDDLILKIFNVKLD